MILNTIYGPPGTGKTTELVQIAHDRLKTRGLFLSYTKAAAQEATNRLQGGHIEASTLHSLAFKRLGLNRAAVVDQRKLGEFGTVAGIPFKGMDGADSEQEGDEYMSVHSYAMNRMISFKEAYDEFGRPGNPRKFNMFVNAYDQWKQTYGYLDFDDMLVRASKLKYFAIPLVILDEAQDCSPLQWSVFEAISLAAKEVFIAGDDDQAIYEWGGADPHGMDRFTARYNGAARVLKQSHRLPVTVWKKADLLAMEINQRVKKVWLPAGRNGEVSSWGTFKLLVPVDADWHTLILARDNYRLRELQRELHEDRVPYALATSNGPYENRFARAMRGWLRDEVPTEDERKALIEVCDMQISKLADQRMWKEMRCHDWRRSIMFPIRQRDFYHDLRPDQLFAPLRFTLSTIHQAKGGEADQVLLDLSMTPRVERGIDLNPDAERRVWYVGMTRARHSLALMGGNPLL